MIPGVQKLVSADDVFRFQLVVDARISPDGEQVVYSLQRTDLDLNKYPANLWRVATAGSQPQPFTRGDDRDTNPRWSPSGRSIAFLSTRGETSQVWLIPVNGGEAEQLTDLEEGSIRDLQWSPDGSRLAFLYRPKPLWALKSTQEGREKAHRSTPPIRITRLVYRAEGEGYIGDERWHLFVLDVATREVTQLTQGEHDQGDFCWSPDSSRLAFITNRSPDPDCTPQLREIRTISASGGEELPIPAPMGPKGALAWSPDGRWFAYYGHADVRDVWSATDPHLWVLPSDGGDGQDLSAALDRSCGDATLGDLRAFSGWDGPVWAPDSDGLYFLASDRGSVHLYRTSRSNPELTNLTLGLSGGPALLSMDRDCTRAVCPVTEPLNPGDVHLLDLATPGSTRRLTGHNAELLKELWLTEPREFTAATDGGEVHGWLVVPREASARNPVPLVLYVHGGPHTQYGWGLLHEFQLLARKGLAVLYLNPRGSRGYGQGHVAAIRGDWGGADFRDVMAGVEQAVTLPEIDGERVAIIGGSYGGFMTGWAVGHTDRFRCAVAERGVFNLHSMAGTCDFNFSRSEYFGGNTWDDPGPLLRQSPLTYAGNVTTPVLIIHSEGDLRCPIEQAEQFFAALKEQGKEVEFIRYPREANHGLSRGGPPDLRLHRLNTIVEWFEQYLLNEDGR